MGLTRLNLRISLRPARKQILWIMWHLHIMWRLRRMQLPRRKSHQEKVFPKTPRKMWISKERREHKVLPQLWLIITPLTDCLRVPPRWTWCMLHRREAAAVTKEWTPKQHPANAAAHATEEITAIVHRIIRCRKSSWPLLSCGASTYSCRIWMSKVVTTAACMVPAMTTANVAEPINE